MVRGGVVSRRSRSLREVMLLVGDYLISTILSDLLLRFTVVPMSRIENCETDEH